MAFDPAGRLHWARGLMTVVLPWLLACDESAGHGAMLGAECESDAQCGELVCALAEDTDPEDLEALPLTCVPAREAGGPRESCEEADGCDHGICLLAGACAVPCATSADCSEDERCAEVFARTADDALQSLQACVRSVELPDDARVHVEVMKDALDQDVARPIALSPPTNEGRPFVVLEHPFSMWPGSMCRTPLCLDALENEAGDVLYDADADYRRGEPPAVPVANSDHVSPLVLRLPTPEEAGFSERGYVATLHSEQAGDLTVTTITRERRGQRLDLNIFYVGAQALAPDGDRGPAVLADALDVVDEILGQAGIFVGEVRQIAIGGALPMRGTYFDRGDQAAGFTLLRVRFGTHVELPGLFRLSAGAANSAVNLFMLSDIEPRMLDAEPQAEAGGVPGPPGMHGTDGSGIAIAADMMLDDAQAFGRTLAHELGHYLGLFHTSEADGRVLEALPDTPECRAGNAQPGDLLDPAVCEGLGSDNLMFWAVTSGSLLTDAQREVLASSPVLR